MRKPKTDKSDRLFQPKGDLKRLLRNLKWLKQETDLDQLAGEWAHGSADDVLLDFIGEKEVTDLYNDIEKWYS